MIRRGKGFTLVEMIIALSIFSLMMTLLMAGYSQGLELWKRATEKTSRWQSIEYRHALMAQLFRETRIADYRGEGGVSYPHFIATSNTLEFTTRSPILDMSGRVRPVRLIFEGVQEESGENIENVIYQEAERHNDLGRGISWDAARQVPLFENISQLSFKYLAPAFPMPQELILATLTEDELLRYRDNPEWLNWYDASVLWKTPLAIEFQFIDDQDVSQTWLFQLPKESEAWSLQGQLSEYQ